MTTPIGLCLILLTYKGKVLLLQKDDILNSEIDNPWHFIKRIIGSGKSPEKTIIQEVRRETQISLEKVTLLSTQIYENTTQYLFYAQLSDSDVNSLQRGKGKLLNFFGLKELPGLVIQPSTKLFFQSNGNFTENLLTG